MFQNFPGFVLLLPKLFVFSGGISHHRWTMRGWARLWSPHLWWPWWARETQRGHGSRCGLHWMLSFQTLSCGYMIYIYIYLYSIINIYIYTQYNIYIYILYVYVDMIVFVRFLYMFAYILISIQYIQGTSLPAAFWRTIQDLMNNQELP